MIIRQLAQNRPLGGFLDGIPPRRFEPRSVLENEKRRSIALKAPFAPKAASGSQVPQIAPPYGQAYFGTRRAMHKGQDGVPGFRAASGRLKRKSAVRQNGAIKTGADNGAHGRASRAPTPQAKAFGRIPKNRPLGGFLDGIPPHRFEPRSVLENKKTAGAFASAVKFLERTTGLEPATPTLARWCSTN